MLKKLKQLFTHTTIYGIGDIATSVVGLLLLPVFTRYLSPTEYGIIALLLSVEAVTKVIFRWGVDSAYLRLSYDYPEREARQRLASTIFFFLVIVNGLLLGIGLTVSPWIATQLFEIPEHVNTLRLVLVNTYVIGLFFLPFQTMRFEQRSRRFATISFSRSALTLVMRLVLVVGIGFGVRGVVLADLVVTTVYALVLGYWYGGLIRAVGSMDMLRGALKFGLPRLPHGIAHQATAVSDRYLLSTLASVSDVGVYAIGASIGLGMKYFTAAFQTAWSPFLFEMMDKHDARDTHRTVATYVFLTLVLLAAGLSALADDLVRILTPDEFHAAATVVPWIAVGVLFQGIYQLTSVGLAITKQTRYYPITTALAAATNITANLTLIPSYGILGAAWANTASYGVLAATGMMFSQRHYPMRYEWGRLLRICAAGVVAYACAQTVPIVPFGAIGNLLVRGVTVCISYVATLMVLRFFSATEIARLRRLFVTRIASTHKSSPLTPDDDEQRELNIP